MRGDVCKGFPVEIVLQGVPPVKVPKMSSASVFAPDDRKAEMARAEKAVHDAEERLKHCLWLMRQSYLRKARRIRQLVERLNEQALIDSSPASPPRSADDNNRRRSSGSFDGVGGAGDDASSVGNGGASTAGGQQQQQQQQQPLPTTQQQAGIDAGLLMEAPGGTILISRAELEVSFFFFNFGEGTQAPLETSE